MSPTFDLKREFHGTRSAARLAVSRASSGSTAINSWARPCREFAARARPSVHTTASSTKAQIAPASQFSRHRGVTESVLGNSFNPCIVPSNMNAGSATPGAYKSKSTSPCTVQPAKAPQTAIAAASPTRCRASRNESRTATLHNKAYHTNASTPEADHVGRKLSFSTCATSVRTVLYFGEIETHVPARVPTHVWVLVMATATRE